MRRLIPALLLTAALTLPGCASIKQTFKGWTATPLESALLASRETIEAGAEWYVDACRVKVPGLAATDEVCATFADIVGPSAITAHNAAVDFAVVAASGGSQYAYALATIDAALSALRVAAQADDEPRRIYSQLNAALSLLRLRISGVN